MIAATADTTYVNFASGSELANELLEDAEKDIRRVTRNKRHRRYTPSTAEFVTKGNYTFAAVALTHWKIAGPVTGVGFAKRRPTDKYDRTRGYKIALKRAIEAAITEGS